MNLTASAPMDEDASRVTDKVDVASTYFEHRPNGDLRWLSLGHEVLGLVLPLCMRPTASTGLSRPIGRGNTRNKI
jgi:hypothetical protein